MYKLSQLLKLEASGFTGVIFSAFIWLLVLFYCVTGGILALQFFCVLISDGFGTNGEKIRNIGLVIAAFFGTPLVIWRSKIANEQAKIAEKRLITDRFSKAVDQIGSVRKVPQIDSTGTNAPIYFEVEQPNIEVRLGGIYTLQRLLEDSVADHTRVVHTLCAYIRLNSLRHEYCDGEDEPRPPDIDIQATLKILGERAYERCTYEMNSKVVLDLSGSYLLNANLSVLKFPFVDLGNADLRFSLLRHTDFRQAWLGWANFRYSDIYNCKIDRASLRGADLRNTNITQKMLESAHGVKAGFGKTLLPNEFDENNLPEHWFTAEVADKDSETLREAYFTHYRNYLDNNDKTWQIKPDVRIKLGEVKLSF